MHGHPCEKMLYVSIERDKNVRIFVSALCPAKQSHTELPNCCYRKAI